MASGNADRLMRAAGLAIFGALLLSPARAADADRRDPCVNSDDPDDAMVSVADICVDKYEASVWGSSAGGRRYGVNGTGNDDYPCADNGEGCRKTIFARSVRGVKPSTWLTWFQAAMACANSGKRLPTNAEWQLAALGTPDPGGGNSFCNVASSGTPAATGSFARCVSDFGVYDMAGNVWEWTADWGQYGSDPGGDAFKPEAWGSNYGNDGAWNVRSSVKIVPHAPGWRNGQPGVVRRGGGWVDGVSAGIFAFDGINGPSISHIRIGFRCVRHPYH